LCYYSPSPCFSVVWPSCRGGWRLPRWSCRPMVLGRAWFSSSRLAGSVPVGARFAFRCPGCAACRGGLPGGLPVRGFGRWLVVRLAGFVGSGWFGLSEGFAVRLSGGFFFGTSTNRPGRRRNGCAQGLGSRPGTVCSAGSFGFDPASGLVSLRAATVLRARSRTLSSGWLCPAFVCLEKEKPRKAGADCYSWVLRIRMRRRYRWASARRM